MNNVNYMFDIRIHKTFSLPEKIGLQSQRKYHIYVEIKTY